MIAHLEKLYLQHLFQDAVSCNSPYYRELQYRIFKVISKNCSFRDSQKPFCRIVLSQSYKPPLRRFFVFKVVPLKGSQNFLHKRIFKKERTEVFAMPDRQPFFPNATHRERDRRMREAPNRLLSRFPTKPEDLPSAVCSTELYRYGSYCGSCA